MLDTDIDILSLVIYAFFVDASFLSLYFETECLIKAFVHDISFKVSFFFAQIKSRVFILILNNFLCYETYSFILFVYTLLLILIFNILNESQNI